MFFVCQEPLHTLVAPQLLWLVCEGHRVCVYRGFYQRREYTPRSAGGMLQGRLQERLQGRLLV